MPSLEVRPAKKAGSWYESDASTLSKELHAKLDKVPDTVDGSSVPIAGARVIISPHAGYGYSGQCAAWAYKSLDLSKAKRVFILGPSHTYYLDDCAITTFEKWATPFGDLIVDTDVLQEVQNAADTDTIPVANDINEHSMEMQAPYLYLRMQQTFDSPEKFPKIVPILIGNLSRAAEKEMGKALLPYFKDPENAFVISSDFCHWGARNFSYSLYSPDNDISNLIRLRETDPVPQGPAIHESIKLLDETAMDAVKSGNHDAFLNNLKITKNTVCGRHPIGVAMAALELIAKEIDDETKARFKIVQYDRSNLVHSPSDYSVSYVSAYAIL